MTPSDCRTSINYSHRNPVVGFFIGGINYAYHYQILSGISSAFNKHNTNIICFMGGPVNSPYSHEKMANLIYQYAKPGLIDGLIISGSINIHNRELRIFNAYRDIPLVLIAMELDGIPTIKVQNDSGFRDLLRHLICDHGYRRLAYIGGPQPNTDAQQRYQIYREVLDEYQISFDPDLITSGQIHLKSTGNDAIREYLDIRKVTFEAVVAANDVLAMGAIEELFSRGIRVPEQIAVTGFDDQEWAKYFISPLTTVRQSIYDLGRFSADLMVKLLEGKSVPQEVFLDTELVIRSSCGCFSKSISKIIQSSSDIIDDPERENPISGITDLAKWQKMIVPAMIQAFESNGSDEILVWVDQVINGFIADLRSGCTENFITNLQRILQEQSRNNRNLSQWHTIITMMQQYGCTLFPTKIMARTAENLWHQARVLIGETLVQIESHRSYRILEQALAVDKINQVLNITFNIEGLTDAL